MPRAGRGRTRAASWSARRPARAPGGSTSAQARCSAAPSTSSSAPRPGRCSSMSRAVPPSEPRVQAQARAMPRRRTRKRRVFGTGTFQRRFQRTATTRGRGAVTTAMLRRRGPLAGQCSSRASRRSGSAWDSRHRTRAGSRLAGAACVARVGTSMLARGSRRTWCAPFGGTRSRAPCSCYCFQTTAGRAGATRASCAAATGGCAPSSRRASRAGSRTTISTPGRSTACST
mmetsp:Transcript_10/g.43  ORF Transcript_10/g.43 Transcript_10/m.43 type:complete len:230 (+) Transcript_10:558-1247(+)